MVDNKPKTVLGEGDFVEVVDERGEISSVPEAWTKRGSSLLPPGTRKATDANIRAAKARKATPGEEKVDVDQIRADAEASVREEHEAALAERDERIAELEQQLEEATAELDAGDGDKAKPNG